MGETVCIQGQSEAHKGEMYKGEAQNVYEVTVW